MSTKRCNDLLKQLLAREKVGRYPLIPSALPLTSTSFLRFSEDKSRHRSANQLFVIFFKYGNILTSRSPRTFRLVTGRSTCP